MSFCRTSACLFAAAVLAASDVVRAQTPTEWHAPMLAPGTNRPVADTDHPRWVLETLEPTNRARIERMVEGNADVVVLNSGYYQGFRNGVVCLVQHRDQVVRLIVVAAEENRSAALIMGKLPNDVVLVPGDEVRVSIL